MAPPAIYLGYTREKTHSSIGVSGQNCYLKPSGAFTGENRYHIYLVIRYGYHIEIEEKLSRSIL